VWRAACSSPGVGCCHQAACGTLRAEGLSCSLHLYAERQKGSVRALLVCILHPCLCSGMLVSCDPVVGPVVLVASHTVHGLHWRASLTMRCTLS
jgi:hypothetical protein